MDYPLSYHRNVSPQQLPKRRRVSHATRSVRDLTAELGGLMGTLESTMKDLNSVEPENLYLLNHPVHRLAG
ncbi:MAG: hypothetical protein SFW62_01105 [Alphaproteobacteria bacterium]|nr:hypothetical protein [Alphaproteobacteria bacterium]